MKQKAVHIGL